MSTTRIGLEIGSTWVFASAVDWPGTAARPCCPRPPGAVGATRDGIAGTLLEGSTGTTWPLRYLIRRAAWHVLDHAWELEDKSR